MKHALACSDVFEFEQCLLVVPRHEPRLFLLNQTAKMIWQGIARGASPDQTAERLAARFEVPIARVRGDIETILAEWRAHKLMTDTIDDRPLQVGLAIDQAHSRADSGEQPSVGRRFHADRVYALCERPIRLRFEDAEIEQVIHPPLAHTAVTWKEPADVIDVLRDRRGYCVVCNGSDVERASTLEDALGQVFGRILELSYPDAEWLAMMHAAAVGDERGAVVMAGDSGSGKSTLTAALVHAGLRYFSDDVVSLDDSLRIRPMPLAISLKPGSWPVLASRYPEIEALAIHKGWPRRYLPVASERTGPAAGLPVRCLVFPRYFPDQPTAVRRLSVLEVLERLTRVRSWLSLDGGRFRATLDWVKKTPGYELSHASLEEGVRVIETLLSGGRA